MSLLNDVTFPPLTPSQTQRLTYYDQRLQNDTIQSSEEGQEEIAADVSVQPSARKMCWTGSHYMYAGPGRKPQLLKQLESYINKELQTISSSVPHFQEQKLQVYRDAFGCFIKEFKTYQPFLSAIKKEYENTLAYQKDQIRELEPLRSHLRLVTEECERKNQVHWEEEQSEIRALKMEKQKLQRVIEAMKEKEKAMQAVVERLQSELSAQYLQYREERDARQLLIWQLNDLTRGSVKEEHPADENSDAKDPVELQLSLKVCRGDLTKAQEELTRIRAEYWDIVPRRNWDTLEQTHQQNLLKMQTLKGEFDQLKVEHDILLELHKEGSMQNKTHEPSTEQTDESVSQVQNQNEYHNLNDQTGSDAPEKSTLTVQELRTALKTMLPLKSDEEINELVTLAQSESDGSDDCISYQRLHSLLAESVEVVPPALEVSEDKVGANPLQASD
ncbi:hypothetical protein PBY51_012350 [Eleginops maclovinus]|uniref:Translin-associated factor X-interacting protein 1 N-terminal domain-containing protein n=1 Tax=Eleginops maclovinus TaxID=56733 RepID=A0AAN7XVS1_ELEMC|nr:hypothetical protein PBY51_012350 [Eleginops maclovinus]